jgi:hypothetical protein
MTFRILKKLGIMLLGMTLFLLTTMWLKGLEITFRTFLALFAGLSAWMGLVSLVVWLWKDAKTGDEEARI